MSLVFYEKSHRYKLDGRWVPGVTTLIKGGLPSPALIYWSARSVAEWVVEHPELTEEINRLGGKGPTVAFLKSVPWQQRDTAAIRGTDVHSIGEQLVYGDEVQVPAHLADHVRGYVEWLDREQAKPLHTERPVASRKWGYAGKFDLIGELHGQTWLLDLKTASGVYGDNALQLAAYANAEFMVADDGEEQPLPPIDKLGVLHVMPGETVLYEVTDPAAAFKDFLHVAWTANAADRIKNYLKEVHDD